MSGLPGAHTSVPRWERVPPGADVWGRSFAVICVGEAAREVGAVWLRQIADRGAESWSCQVEPDDETVGGLLHEQLALATVGWRLMLAGPEADVLRLRSEALTAGAVPTEIRTYVTTSARRRVCCIHCGRFTAAEESVGGVLSCAGCGRRLVIYHHVSRRLAAYLGYQVDAED